MYQTVNFNTFHDSFKSIRPDNFNYHGLRALFDYLEQVEESMGESIELDVIAICCDYTQYDTIEEALEAYGLDSREELEENCTVLDCDDNSIVMFNY